MPSKKSAQARIRQWWNAADDKSLAAEIFETVNFIEQDQAERRERNLRCVRLYGNAGTMGMGPYSYSRTEAPNLPDNRVKYSVVTACSDTVGAKVSKMRPKVSFLTSGGDFSIQERAKNLTKWVSGAFSKNDVYCLHQAMFRDATIFDLAALKHFRDGNRIRSERCLPNEIYVDFADGMYGKPTHMYHVKFVHKETLAAAYPKSKGAIMMSAAVLDETNQNVNMMDGQESEYVLVIESWKLPTSPDAKDGRHVISVEKGVLLDETWTREYFPFTFMRWAQPVVGFYGQSLVDRLTGNQIEINKMLRIIQRSFHLGSAFKVFLEYGSRVAKEHINNEIGSIVYYAGAKPEFYTPQTVHPEFFRHLEWLIQSSFEESGISQLSATSRLPTGLDTGSGKALREYNDLETERFVIIAQMYEQSFLETARQYIDLAREMHEDGVDFEVVAEAKRFVELIKWSDTDMKHNDYVMQMWPTSSLPQTPAGRLAYVQELINGGFIDKLWGLSLLEFPDVEGYTSLELAPLDDLLRTLDLMLYKGKPQTPEPFQNLELGLQLFQQAYLKAKKDGAPDSRLDLLRRWMTQADAMLSKSKNAAQMVPGAVPPQANPTLAGGAQMLPPAGPPAMPGMGGALPMGAPPM